MTGRGQGRLLATGASVATLLLAAALVPLRHRARLEADPGNPVQRVVLESRSAFGFLRTAWGGRLQGGPETWGDARSGFFVAPVRPERVELQAWPGFRRTFDLQPIVATATGSLRSQGDRDAFRAWFVALLEAQLDRPSPLWEPAQRDCAGLMRFCFREAWGPHTAEWRDRLGFSGPPVSRDPDLAFAGPWRRAFPTPDGWQPFAKGSHLRDLACVPLGPEPALARPGDLLFFSRGGARQTPDHVMAFVRPEVDGQPMLIYHTGPERPGRPASPNGAGEEAGEVRRVRLADLMQHPDGTFRPHPENPAFLGLFRWRVLAEQP